MTNNEALQKEVQHAFKWEPMLSATKISVTAKDGVITLTGLVDSFTKKRKAETVAKQVAGVRQIVENIQIEFKGAPAKSDHELLVEIVNAFKWNWQIPDNKVKINVEDGWVTLEGEFTWNYQKIAANDAVARLIGIKGVTNDITINSDVHDEIEKRMIEHALERNASIKAQNVEVNIDGNKVTLAGTVGSWYEKDEAEKTAWNAPGVRQVENNLHIEYKYSPVDYDTKN